MRCTGRARVRLRRGFSLLELMVVVVFIAILSGLTLPKLRTATAVYDLDRAARQFASDLQLAQAEAGRRSRSVTVTRVDGSTYRAGVTIGATEQVLFQRSMNGGSAFSATWSPISFRPFGPPVLPVAAPMDIAVTNDSRSRTIRIAAGGAVMLRP